MQRIIFIAVLFGSLSPLTHAKDDDPAAGEGLANGGATAAAKAHLRAFLGVDFEKLKQSYAPRVRLMPGGEMLKPEYGLAGAGGRSEAKTVEREKLIAAMEKAFGDKPIIPADKMEDIFKTFRFTVLQRGLGDAAADPPDPLDAGDGKLHFTLKDGDVLIKAGPEKGDFVLFQLRRNDGRWQVVAEYLD